MPEEWNSQSGGIPRGVELPGGGTPSRVELPGRVKLGGIRPEWNPQVGNSIRYTFEKSEIPLAGGPRGARIRAQIRI